MKRKSKKKKFISRFAGRHIKVGENCKDCVNSDIPITSIARVRCIYHKPKVIFHPKYGWICFSFSQKMLGLDEMGEENDLKTELTEA